MNLVNFNHKLNMTHGQLPHSSGFVDEQSANFPGREEDFSTLFDLTNSLARFAAMAAYIKSVTLQLYVKQQKLYNKYNK